MKIAVQHRLLPGHTPADRAKWARDHGVEAIEVTSFEGPIAELPAVIEQLLPVLPVSSICGNKTVDDQRGFDFLHPEPAKRRASIEGSKALLKLCAQIGAVGQIVPPIFGAPVVPDLSPWKKPLEIEEELMLAACRELGPFAAELKVKFMLEPLNRYEQHYLRKQSDAVRIIKQLDSKTRQGIGLLSDFFHMHIEETNTPQALADCAKYTTHVHLADNTRQEPGTGDIDLVAAFKVLKKNKFKGYLAYECSISGKNKAQCAKNLARSLDYVRQCISKA